MRLLPVLPLLLLACTSPETTTVQRLAPEAFLSSLEAAPAPYLIDCRTPDEQADGMLPGAVSMDFRSPAFREAADQLDPTRPVYVYCAAGGRSARAAQVFDSLGFTAVYDLEGGYRALE